MKKLFVLILAFHYCSPSYSQDTGEKNPYNLKSKSSLNGSSLSSDSSSSPQSEKKYYLKLSTSSYPPVTTTVSNVETEVKVKDSVVPGSSKTVEYYNEMIRSVDEKVEWVKNDPEENEQALQTGWYEKMEAYRKEYIRAREELINNSVREKK